MLQQKEIRLFIKREDLLHPFISGNKYRKLCYNLQEVQKLRLTKLLTFGGAYSNHIAATAYAGKVNGINTIGIIRGDELLNRWKENPTLKFAHDNGMVFKFVTRSWYRNKNTKEAEEQLKEEFGDFYMLPEGGTNALAVKGCEEILQPKDTFFTIIATCVGTGGTIAGIINSTSNEQQVIGFPSLKSNFLPKDIRKFAKKENWHLETNYHFGGYGKVTKELIDFMNDFKKQTGIPLDPIYTGKMMYGILKLAENNYFKPKATILAIHSGGLQGIAGMNITLKNKNLPILL